MNPWVLVRTVVRWASAGYIAYEAASIVEEVGDKFPDADVTIDASGLPVGQGPYRMTKGAVAGVVLVTALVAYALRQIGKQVGL